MTSVLWAEVSPGLLLNKRQSERMLYMHTNAKQTTLTYFDRTAADYNTSHDGKFVRPMYRTVLEEALSLPWRDVLDIGCGNGNLLAALLEARPEAHYHGVDLSPNMAAEARRRLGHGVSIQVGDAEHLPCASASFDLLICNAVFHHCTAPEAALAEMVRVLRPGGTLLLGDPTVPLPPLRALMNWGLSWGQSGDAHLYGKREIVSLLACHGFVLRRWRRVNYKSFVLRAEKQ